MRLFTILNGICQYLAARNKTLWSGTWSSGSITVPDTDKYRTFIIKFGTQYMTAIRNLDDSITGTLFFASNNGQNVFQNLFTATVSGNRWTFKTQTQFGHYGSSSHSAFQQINPAYTGPNEGYIQGKAVLSGRISEHDRMACICFCHRSLEIALKGVAA